MHVFRTGRRDFIHLLDGKGGLVVEGRWHLRGYEIIYTSASMSLCLLEVFKIQPLEIIPINTCGVELFVPDESIEVFDAKSLKDGWNHPAVYLQDLQKFGTQWLKECRSLVLKVPSAVVPSEFNYLINPTHSSASKIKILKQYNLEVENGYLNMEEY